VSEMCVDLFLRGWRGGGGGSFADGDSCFGSGKLSGLVFMCSAAV